MSRKNVTGAMWPPSSVTATSTWGVASTALGCREMVRTSGSAAEAMGIASIATTLSRGDGETDMDHPVTRNTTRPAAGK